jgi:hypothetical protein
MVPTARPSPVRLKDPKILAYLSHIVSQEPFDASRRFVWGFFVQDNTLAIREPPMRNSGFVSGSFLSRSEVFLEAGQRLTDTHDLVGAAKKAEAASKVEAGHLRRLDFKELIVYHD